MITNEIIDSFLRCDYKSYLQSNKILGCRTDYEILESELQDLYKKQFYKKLREYPENQILSVDDFQKKIQVEKIAFIIAPAHWSQVKELGNLSRGKKNHVKLPSKEELSNCNCP